MNVLTVSVTAAGAEVAARLPFAHVHGDLGDTVRSRWDSVDGFVLVCATGIAVRTIGPLLGAKQQDPAVVCVDDAGRWSIALTGGHHGANDLAYDVAALLDADPIVTTATDAAGLPPLDTLPGLTAEGDIAAVTRSWLDGHPPTLLVDEPLTPFVPPALAKSVQKPGNDTGSRTDFGVVRVSDRDDVASRVGVVVLRPASLVVGVGASSGADPDGIADLVLGALAGAGLSPAAVGVVATADIKRTEPGIVALAARLGAELRTFPSDALAAVAVPNPSDTVAAAVGTRSVAEAAALLAAGPDASLLVPKQRSTEATVAVVRRAGPEGHLAVVGLGPGTAALRTLAATAAVRSADVVVGYGPYVELAADLLTPRHEVVRSPIGAEADRCAAALDLAAGGRRVALVCSGDPGVFAMASLVFELAPAHGHPSVTVVPGVTAALAAAAVLGAPLGHDHAAVSLSDLLTPWSVIEQRVGAVAEGDMAVSFYNPRSERRDWQLVRALEILRKQRPPECPVAVVTDVGRPAEDVVRTTLAEVDQHVAAVGMLSLVVVGSSTSRWIGERMVTPRGYISP